MLKKSSTLIVWTCWITCSCFLRVLVATELYLSETEQELSHEHREHHCLLLAIRPEWEWTITMDFCLRPTDDFRDDPLIDSIPNVNYKKFTFEDLSRSNISSAELLSWSIPIELVEDYQLYLQRQTLSSSSKEVFRCVQPWFGSRCQYSFYGKPTVTFFETVSLVVKEKLRKKSLIPPGHSTCYLYLTCKCNGIPYCLHWNEICDGRIHCTDGEEDERFCSALELNECNENEYRCHNGLCIPKDFVNNTIPECLDRSDIWDDDYIDNPSYRRLFDFLWNEYSCRPGDQNFVCGDGQCVNEFHRCENGRHQQLIDYISVQGNLTKDCWFMMLCLTKLRIAVNNLPCEQFLRSINVTVSMQSCDLVIEFPTQPILLHHVRFLYHRHHLTINHSRHALTPTYICYDAQLCEHLPPTFLYRKLSCRNASQMGVKANKAYDNWTSIIDAIRPNFDGCMLPTQRQPQLADSSSLYCCQNSSKCISKHRVVDGIIDCPFHDDEQASSMSCSIKNNYRFKCDGEDQCRSPLFSLNVCPAQHDPQLSNILFYEVCNRISQASSSTAQRRKSDR